MEWMLNNWDAVAGVLAALVIVFDRLAKLTPTKKDDQAVSMLYRSFAILGLKVRDKP